MGLTTEQVPLETFGEEEMGTDCRGTITLNEGSPGHTWAWDPALPIRP